jgi:hypothetical protein
MLLALAEKIMVKRMGKRQSSLGPSVLTLPRQHEHLPGGIVKHNGLIPAIGFLSEKGL